MLSLPRTSTYFLTSSFFLTMVLSQDQDFMNWVFSPAEESVEERSEEKEPNPGKFTMILPKVEETPEPPRHELPRERQLPLEAPTPINYKETPSIPGNEKKSGPSSLPPKVVVQVPGQLRQTLPEEEEDSFNEKVERGKRLID